ncbi:hypothetical protein MD484_g3160, partial [Candolleomyces efflorescens]
MSPTTARKKSLQSTKDPLRTPSPSLPTPPRTPGSGSRSRRPRVVPESKASRALHRLRTKLRARKDRASASPKNASTSSSHLLPPPSIGSVAGASKSHRKANIDAPADGQLKDSVPLGDVIEISSDENDRDTTPTAADSTYRGRLAESRVRTKSSKDVSPLRTRGFFKRIGSTLEDSLSVSRKASTKSSARRKLATEASDGEVSHAGSESSDLPETVSQAIQDAKKGHLSAGEDDFSSDFSAGEYDSEDSFIDNSGRVEGGEGNDSTSDEMPSDEEDQVKLATFNSIITQLSGDLPPHKSQRAVEEATKAFRSSLRAMPSRKTRREAKGKRKASPSPSPELEGKESDIEGQVLPSPSKKSKISVNQHQSGAALLNSGSSSQGPSLMAPATPLATPNSGNATTAAGGPLVPTTPTPGGAPLTMAALLAQTPGATGTKESNARYVQRVERLPDVCGIEIPDGADPVLAGDYAILPNLVAGTMTPWTNTRGRPHPQFQEWASLIPNMNATLALSIVRFTEVGKYINPSRISPMEVHLKEILTDPPRYHVVRNRRVCYGVTLGAVSRSQLFSRSSSGMRQKSINIRGIEIEWDRLVAFACMVSGHNPIAAQYGMNSLQVATKSDFTKRGDSKTPLYTDEWTIDSDDDVPVYDAREAQNFNFLSDVGDIENHLPMWNSANGETSHAWTLGCNIRWVMVLGAPKNVSGL